MLPSVRKCRIHHSDSAEQLRYIIVPPVFSGTLQCSPINDDNTVGGDFGGDAKNAIVKVCSRLSRKWPFHANVFPSEANASFSLGEIVLALCVRL
jgi:hypothetical protein